MSTGIRNIRHVAAAVDDANDLTDMGRSFVPSWLFRNIRTPVFAAVSPNRDNGPDHMGHLALPGAYNVHRIGAP